MTMSATKVENKDAKRDPITGALGAHPLGTGLGAVGGVTGGLAGKGVGETANPTVEDGYWSDNFPTSTHGSDGTPYTEYAPAYKYGRESQTRYTGRQFEDVEGELEHGWESAKGTSKLAWNKAKSAVRDAWHRVERAMPGDADNDGR